MLAVTLVYIFNVLSYKSKGRRVAVLIINKKITLQSLKCFLISSSQQSQAELGAHSPDHRILRLVKGLTPTQHIPLEQKQGALCGCFLLYSQDIEWYLNLVDAQQHCYYMSKKVQPTFREDNPSPGVIGRGQGHNPGYMSPMFLPPNSGWVLPEIQAATEAIKGFLNYLPKLRTHTGI